MHQAVAKDSQMNIPPAHQGSWAALITVSIATFILVCSEFLPIGVLNLVAQEFNISSGRAGLMISLPGAVAALAACLLPVISKALDRRLILLGLTLICLIANLLTAYAENFELLLFSRVLLGFAIGGFWAIAIALSPRLAPQHLPIAKATAFMMVGVTVATVFGVPLGTWLSQFWGWRSAFLITAAITLILIVAEWIFLPRLKPLSSLKFKELPILFKVPKARLGIAITLLIGIAHFSSFSYLAPFFKHSAHFDTALISLLLFAYGIAGVVGNAFSGWCSHINVRYSMIVVGLCLGVVFLLFPYFAIYTSGAFILTALWGFAFGAFPTTANIWMLIHAPHVVEKGMPLFVGMFQVNIALGAFLGGVVVDRYNENILMSSVLIFVALALAMLFTFAQGVHNPKHL